MQFLLLLHKASTFPLGKMCFLAVVKIFGLSFSLVLHPGYGCRNHTMLLAPCTNIAHNTLLSAMD